MKKKVFRKIIIVLMALIINFVLTKYKSNAASSKINLYLETSEDSSADLPVHCLVEFKENIFRNYKQIINYLGLDSYNYYLSKCAPFMEITFNNYEDYCTHKYTLYKQLNSKYINSSIIYNNFQKNSTINDSTYDNPYIFSDVLLDIGVNNPLYTGLGVKVGIIDEGIPDVTTNFSNSTVHLYGNNISNHATIIASIIGGSSGIAPDVEFYCCSCSYGDSINFIQYCEELVITQDVDIVVICMDLSNMGGYNPYSQFIDYLVRATNCTFVLSAGNSGMSNAAIVSPNNALNAITVGSIDANKNVSVFSSWNVGQEQMFKPEVVAPGGHITGIPNITGTYSGTSYSAPMVAGVVALLMEENSFLKFRPDLVKCLIEVGSTKLPTQTSYYDNQAGFGLVNYANSRFLMNNNQYGLFKITNHYQNGDTVSTSNFTLPSNNGIYVIASTNAPALNIVHYTNGPIDDYEVIFNQSVNYHYSNYLIKLFNSANYNLATSSTNTNNNYLVFSNSTIYNRNLDLKIVLNSDKANDYSHYYDPNNLPSNGVQEWGSYVYSFFEHYHNYNYIWNNYIRHRSICSCGSMFFDAHVVAQNAFQNGELYAQCLLCGGLATNGNVPFNMYNNINYITNNGSYMLPNGIIVVVDDDLYLLQNRDIYNIINSY